MRQQSLLFSSATLVAIVVVGLIASYVYQRRRNQRERAVELAAAEATDDDPAFAPDAVRERAAQLFVDVHDARNRGDRSDLAALLTPGLFAEERRQLDERTRVGWRRHIEVLGLDRVEYLGLVNRDGEGEDRVTVRIRASVRDQMVETRPRPLPPRSPTSIESVMAFLGEYESEQTADDLSTEIAEFWTLAKHADGSDWVVASIESDVEGRHALAAEIVASPSGDVQRMADASLLEVAALDKLPAAFRASEVVDVDYAGDADTAALDLSLVDGRWAPAVLDAAVRRAVAAWAAAVDGGGRDLLDVATAEAAQALLHPGDPTRRTRLVIRGPRVRQLTISALDPTANPPRMTVEFKVRGRRYVQDRNTGAMLSGIKSFAVPTTERWTLALSGPDERPWQIVDTETSAHRILHWIVRVQNDVR
ncbi:MAG TPA: TIM44-like domain-containing protein [Conexibacter sp.]|nr:TIM44-like domain-containing protein [Conexibacter sp.]